MKELKDILEIVDNNDEVIIIKVKEDCEYDLMANGFNPETIYFRCTNIRGSKSFTPIFKGFKEGNTFQFGIGGCTLASDNFCQQRNKIWNYLKELNKDIWR